MKEEIINGQIEHFYQQIFIGLLKKEVKQKPSDKASNKILIESKKKRIQCSKPNLIQIYKDSLKFYVWI